VPGYDAIVYDLDGTLVRLDVDWDAVREQTAAVLRARDVDIDGADIWTIRELAGDHGLVDRVDEVIAGFERDGARSATHLALADHLPHGVPVGVCSLNAESACRIALERHGLDRHVDAVVGRGTVETVKPDPEPLLYALDSVGVAPDQALFVGDSDSDRVAAERAGMAFQWASDRVD
jgi:phosphoglycolate phosphatase